MFTRIHQLQKLRDCSRWDIIVIGGGATGLGIALDAASRGYTTLLLEQSDFSQGTSSRSTKLIHGGVRYLAQGNIPLVKEALFERGLLMNNARHLVQKQTFIIPCHHWTELIKYLSGLKLYDWLSGELSFGKSTWLKRAAMIGRLPNLQPQFLKWGVEYFDGQFDDARLAINIAQTVSEVGGVILNYIKVGGFIKEGGKITGVTATDRESGLEYNFSARCVINATGVFVDDLLQKDVPGSSPLVRPSQGIHLVVDASFLKSDTAMMIPQTSDGRVLFAVPWQGHTLLGTTDTPLEHPTMEPVAMEQEIDFILDTVKDYLVKAPQRKDVLSVFAGLRPLAAPKKSGHSTREISRGHKIVVSHSGLITVIGGKWTTYRKMAEQTVDHAFRMANLPKVSCKTKTLHLHGCTAASYTDHFSVYGTDASRVRGLIQEDPSLAQQLCSHLPHTEAEVVWAVRCEMARTVEDVLARRLRILFLDARAAIQASRRVAQLMQAELRFNDEWKNQQLIEFEKLALYYILNEKINP